jgi:hypothetical protein
MNRNCNSKSRGMKLLYDQYLYTCLERQPILFVDLKPMMVLSNSNHHQALALGPWGTFLVLESNHCGNLTRAWGKRSIPHIGRALDYCNETSAYSPDPQTRTGTPANGYFLQGACDQTNDRPDICLRSVEPMKQNEMAKKRWQEKQANKLDSWRGIPGIGSCKHQGHVRRRRVDVTESTSPTLGRGSTWTEDGPTLVTAAYFKWLQ